MFITLESAKQHLRVSGADDDADITTKAAAAEQIACAYLNRKVFVDQTAMDASIALVPAALIAAGVAYAAADDAANLITDRTACIIEKAYAFNVYSAAILAGGATRNGIVINDLILAAMMLILGDLFGQREDTVLLVSVASMPNGARSILDLHRIAPGV